MAIRPSAYSTITSMRLARLGLSTQWMYASIVSIQNKALSTSFRSATHATDSTCSG
ncbi:MAG: hypothetical protein NTU88_09085 [Armatimonadetes bacterium]|nr:hypothetical protein [Armatimonadota bacterium]